MSKSTRMACACVVLLVLILCDEALCVHGRHLKRRACKKCSRINQMSTNGLKTTDDQLGGPKPASGKQLERSSKMASVDDFRPTAPGHSPGVGHSMHN